MNARMLMWHTTGMHDDGCSAQHHHPHHYRHPGALKDMVTSPGGTTIAGVHELERGGFRATCMNAVLAATQRALELSKPQ